MTDPTGGHNPPNRQSTPEVAKQEAAAVAHTAAERGGQVGDTAGEQVRRVASETTRQARDLLREGRGQLIEQTKEGQRKAAGGLHALADQLADMAEKTDGDGLAPEMARQAADRTRGVANWLDEREPGALLDEVRAFARRRPGVFLTGATLAGVLLGRLTRGAIAAARDDSDSGRHSESASRPMAVPSANPMPAIAPAATPADYPGPATALPGTNPASPGYSVPPPPPAETPGDYPAPATGPHTSPVPGQPGATPASPSYSVPAPPERTGDYPGPVTR